jgi:hypothetical protein
MESTTFGALCPASTTKAEEWGYWPEGRRNPISGVKIGQKWNVRPERILTEEETVKVLARLNDPNLPGHRNRHRHWRPDLRDPRARGVLSGPIKRE